MDVKFAAAILCATFSVLHPPLFTPYSGGSCSAIPALRFGEPSRKGIAALQAHLIGFGPSWANYPIFHIGSGALLCDPLGHALHRAGPEQALAELRLHLLPWPCAGPFVLCLGPEQALLHLFWP